MVIRDGWRDGRVVEGAALEMLLCGNVYEGSNPSLSVFHTIQGFHLQVPFRYGCSFA
jgi:hypothetical protein